MRHWLVWQKKKALVDAEKWKWLLLICAGRNTAKPDWILYSWNKMDSGRKQVKISENRIKIGESFFLNEFSVTVFHWDIFIVLYRKFPFFLSNLRHSLEHVSSIMWLLHWVADPPLYKAPIPRFCLALRYGTKINGGGGESSAAYGGCQQGACCKPASPL